MVRLEFQTQTEVPLQPVHVLHPNFLQSHLGLCTHKENPSLCTKRLKRNGSQDNYKLSHLGSGDSTGEAVKPLLSASKDLQECEDWVSASCKMDQQHCHWIQLNTEPKVPKASSAAQPSCPNLFTNWHIPKFPAYILHGGPVSPSGFYFKCWERKLLLFALQMTGKPPQNTSLLCWGNCEPHQVDPLHLFNPK